MKKLILLIVALSGIMAWQSCQYAWIEEEPADPNDTIPVVISFSADIQPIFDAGCNATGCHAAGAWDPDLSPGNAYQDLFAENLIDTIAPENSILYIEVAPGGAMDDYAKKNDYKTILSWIQQGAKNN
jgi:hypothetical protein